MLKLIEKLQRKSERKRKRILIWTTVCISLVLFTTWLIFFERSIGKDQSKRQTASSTKDNPINTLKDSLSSAFQNFQSASTTASSSASINPTSSPTSSQNSAGEVSP